MSQFITKEDYGASIHAEILAALTREDDSVIDICEQRAIMQIEGFLKQRYDTSLIFQATGEDRNQLVLMYAIDIAIYHITTIHNPRNMTEDRVDRYKAAIKWAKMVGEGELTLIGAPLLPEESQSTILTTGGALKRRNHM